MICLQSPRLASNSAARAPAPSPLMLKKLERVAITGRREAAIERVTARKMSRRLLECGLRAQRRQPRAARAPAVARAQAVELGVEIGGRHVAGGQPQHARKHQNGHRTHLNKSGFAARMERNRD